MFIIIKEIKAVFIKFPILFLDFSSETPIDKTSRMLRWMQKSL